MNAPHEMPFELADDAARLRVPPHSVEAEQSVLGSILTDANAFDRVADLLRPADFYRHEHRVVFEACSSIILAGKPCDVVTVFERLESMGRANDAGGIAGVNALACCVASAGNARRYAEIVRERSILRQLIAATDEIATSAFSPQGRDVGEMLADAESKVMAIGGQRGTASTAQTLDRLMVQLLDRMNDLHERGADEVVGVPTGFEDLDASLSGMQPGDLIVLAARPSMGKTALALNIAEHVSVRKDLPVIVFSMEMSAGQLAMRLASSVGRVSAAGLRNGRLHDEDWGRLAEATERLGRAPMIIDDAGAVSVGELRTKARRLARELGGQPALIVVDYLQLMSGSRGSDENRATELGEISRGLKAMAKELRCPVLALSQLNRSVEARADKRPLMSDLRESGAIEQDADVILFIYRDDYYTKEACREPGVAEILIAKQRSGPIGTVRLGWRPVHTRFESLAPGYVPPAYTVAPRAKPREI